MKYDKLCNIRYHAFVHIHLTKARADLYPFDKKKHKNFSCIEVNDNPFLL